MRRATDYVDRGEDRWRPWAYYGALTVVLSSLWVYAEKKAVEAQGETTSLPALPIVRELNRLNGIEQLAAGESD